LVNYTISAAHRVKNLYRVIANGVIEYFNRITRPIEANKAVFIAGTSQQTGANSGPAGMMSSCVNPCLNAEGTNTISGSME
jgi:hypothetical protein